MAQQSRALAVLSEGFGLNPSSTNPLELQSSFGLLGHCPYHRHVGGRKREGGRGERGRGGGRGREGEGEGEGERERGEKGERGEGRRERGE